VFEEVSAEVVQLLHRRSSDGATNAWELFRANSEVYLDAASTNQAYRQIVMVDGPAVFGQSAWSDRIEGPTRKIAEYLREAVAEGVLEPQPIEPLAHLLTALGEGSVMYVAHADDPVAARQEISECNERLLSGLGLHAPPSDEPTRPRARETMTKGH
jgi:hypothetical protein